MESIAEFFNQNPYVSLISFLVGVASLILTIGFFIVGRKFKRLSYTKKTNRIVSLNNVAVDDLHLFFKDKEISDVSITRIAVWNSGKDVINISDIVESRPLLVGIREGQKENCHILNCSIDYKSNDDNKLEILDNEETMKLQSSWGAPNVFTFKFLEPGDGMVVQIIHTGEAEDIAMDCHIMGGKPFVEIEDDGAIIKRNSALGKFIYQGNIPWGINYLYNLFIIVAMLLMFLALIFSILGYTPEDTWTSKIFILTIIAIFLIGAFIYPFTYIKIPNKIKKKL